MAKLAESPEAHACYARHLSEYALARDLDEADRALMNDATQTSMGTTGSIKNVLLAVVRNPMFSVRTGGTQ